MGIVKVLIKIQRIKIILIMLTSSHIHLSSVHRLPRIDGEASRPVIPEQIINY